MQEYHDLSVRAAQLSEAERARHSRRVVLVDGGVADNLGILELWGPDKSDLFMSDGGAASSAKRRPRHNWLSQLRRIVDVIHDQPSQLRTHTAIAEMAARDQNRETADKEGKADGAVWDMHWPPESHDGDPPFTSLDEKLFAGLSWIPTRLRAMDPDLQRRIVNWGYLACNRSLPYVNRLFKIPPYASAFGESWPFPDSQSTGPPPRAVTGRRGR